MWWRFWCSKNFQSLDNVTNASIALRILVMLPISVVSQILNEWINQLCPTEILRWVKSHVTHFMRAAHWMTCFDLSKLIFSLSLYTDSVHIRTAMATTVWHLTIATPQVWCHKQVSCLWSNKGRNQKTRNQLCAKVSVDTWKFPATQNRRNKVALWTKLQRNRQV